MEFGTVDADKAICVTFEHASRLDDRQYAFIQSAILYTTVTGERRVRVHNLALRVVSLAGNVFQFADMDATVSYMVREGEKPVHLFGCSTAELHPMTSGFQAAFYAAVPDPRSADREMRADLVCVPEVLRRRRGPDSGACVCGLGHSN